MIPVRAAVPAGDDPDLLERDHEATVVATALRAAAAGRGGALVVRGLPGAGRSALLDAVAVRAAGFHVLRAHGTTAERTFPFGVVQQLCQPLVTGASAADFARWERGPAALAHKLLVDEPWSVGHEPTGPVLHGLHSLLLNVSAETPVLLLVDDLQWADGPSLRFLGYLAKRLIHARIMLACAVADGVAGDEPALTGELDTWSALTVSPAALSVAGVRAMIVAELGDPPPELAEIVYDVTGGNPGEVAAAVQQMRATRVPSAPPDDVADRIEALLCHRRLAVLRSAPVPVRVLADALALLGADAEPRLVTDLTGLDQVGYGTALAALRRLGLAPDTPEPRLAHPSLAAGVLATLAGDQRRRLHRQAARALHAAGLPAERVAEDLLLGGAGAGPWAIDVLRSAASAALDRGSAARAAHYLRRALLDAPEDGPCRAGLLVDLAVAERGADPVFAAQQLATAIPFLPPGPERAVAALCVPPAVSAQQPGLRRLLRQAAADLAERDPDGAHRELAVRLEARIRWLALQDPGSLGTAAPRLTELGADRLAGTGAGRELLAVLSCAAALGATRPAAEIAGCVELVLLGEPADPAHTMTSLPVLTQTAVAVDSVAALEPWLDRAAAVARSGEPPGVQAAIAAELSLLYAGTGRLAQARQYAAEALAGAGPGWPETAVLATTALSVVALQTQDLDLAAEIIPTLRSTDDVRMIVGDRMLRGMVAAVSGDLPAALDGFLDAGWHLARCGWIGPGGPPWRLWAAAVHRRLGEPEAARQLAESEHRMAEAWGGPTARGRALRLRGALTPGDAGVELLREGVDVLRASVDKLELARTTVALGRRLGADGRPGADSLLAEGERLARECGASWLEASRTSEYHGPVPRLLRSGRDRLTRAEDAVVALVLRGWTNARIAEELAVTKRAVEKNLTSVYRKLGVAGRAALVRELGAAAPGESR